MNVRLISGKYGGRVIEGSGTKRTHPMGERIRNSLFNMLGDQVEDAQVLDAFAGSGSLGFEALSRGAQSVTFIEKDRVAQRVITNNIKLLDVSKQTNLVGSPVKSWTDSALAAGTKFDLIFADPPYHDPQLSTAMALVGLLKPNGLMVLSYPGRGEVPAETGVVVVDNRSYGEAGLAFYRKESVR